MLSFEYRHVVISRSPLHIIFDASENYVKVTVEETNTESDLNLNIFSKFNPLVHGIYLYLNHYGIVSLFAAQHYGAYFANESFQECDVSRVYTE